MRTHLLWILRVRQLSLSAEVAGAGGRCTQKADVVHHDGCVRGRVVVAAAAAAVEHVVVAVCPVFVDEAAWLLLSLSCCHRSVSVRMVFMYVGRHVMRMSVSVKSAARSGGCRNSVL